MGLVTLSGKDFTLPLLSLDVIVLIEDLMKSDKVHAVLF
jgi:hypothetical protein